jgi:hypothetical protein
VIFWGIQEVLLRKEDSDCLASGFYKEPVESLDVLFLGTSNIHWDINPLILFQEQGISAQNISSGGQQLEISYFFLTEALKRQKPKVVIIDMFAVTQNDDYYEEERTHNAFDSVPMSLNKIKGLRNALKRAGEKDSLIYYLLPLVRYHERWKGVIAEDWLNSNEKHYNSLKGWFAVYSINPINFEITPNLPKLKEIPSHGKKALDNIVALCNKENIALLFIKTPNIRWWCQSYSSLVEEYARKKGIPFIDYNKMKSEINLDVNDSADKGLHLNDTGAIKVSHHLGKYLKEHYNLPDHRGEAAYASWNDDWVFYQQDKAAYFLRNETDWQAYVEKLKNPYYTIYITAKDNIGGEKHRELMEKLGELGAMSEINDKGAWSYQAIVDKGSVIYEKLSQEMLEYRDKVNGHKVSMISAGHNSGNRGRILIDYKDYFVDKRGIGIVVYDNVFNEVVDRVTFDLYDGGKAYR